jgi:hypothetical protein
MDDKAPPSQDAPPMPALRRVLGRAMGVRLLPVLVREPGRPALAAASWLVGYGALWALLHFLQSGTSVTPDPLLSLLGWGALYFAAAIYLALSTTERIYDIVRRDILPHASDAYAAAVADGLGRAYPAPLLVGLPLLVGAGAVAAAYYALVIDVAQTNWPSAERILWWVSYFLYFWAAAVSVVAARFYGVFARHLEVDKERFYVLGAADTPLVKGLARLGTQVLLFWVLIFLIMLSSLVLAALPEGWRIPHNSWLLFLMVPVCSFFSLGFGSIVYLDSESVIRATLRRFANEEVRVLQGASNALLDPRNGKLPDAAERLELLAGWHDRILAGGNYGSRIWASVSIALPLLLPLASAIIRIFKLI